MHTINTNTLEDEISLAVVQELLNRKGEAFLVDYRATLENRLRQVVVKSLKKIISETKKDAIDNHISELCEDMPDIAATMGEHVTNLLRLEKTTTFNVNLTITRNDRNV